MNLIKYVNQKKEALTEREKVSFLVDIARNPILLLDKKKSTEQFQEAIALFEWILSTTFKNTQYQNRLTQILINLFKHLLETNKTTVITPIILNILFKTNPKLNFQYQHKSSKNILPIVLFKTISTTKMTEKEKFHYYKKLLKWISENTNINSLKYTKNLSCQPFFDFFTNEPTQIIKYEKLIYHIVCYHHKYNIDFSYHGESMLNRLCWASNNKKYSINLIKKIIKNAPIHILNKELSYHSNDIPDIKIIEYFLMSQHKSVIEYAFKVRDDLFNQDEIKVDALLINPNLTLSYKKEVIFKYQHKIKTINQIDLYRALEYSQDSEKEIIEFLTFCKNSFNIDKTSYSYASLNHFLCYFDDDHTHLIQKKLILDLNLPHQPNINGRFPLHFFTIYQSRNWKPSTLQHINYVMNALKEKNIDFNCQNNKGNTPLHIAFKLHRHPQIIQALLINGAKLDVKNKYGKTPYDYSKSHKDYNLIKEVVESYYESSQLNMIIENDKQSIKAKVKKI